jgi:hypothetical protein
MELRQAFDPLRALGSSWRLIARAPLTLLVGGVLLFLTDSGPQHGGVHFEGGEIHWLGAALAGTVLLACCCVGLVLWVVNCLLHAGYAGAVRRVMFTGEERFSDLIGGTSLWGAMILARLLKIVANVFTLLPLVFIVGGPIVLGHLGDLEPLGIVVGILLGLAYLPIWIYLALGLALVEPAVALEGKDPVEALRRSWQIARGNRIQLLIYFVVCWIVAFLGLLCCFIGVLFTSTWTAIARYESYVRFALATPEGGAWIDRPQVPSPR